MLEPQPEGVIARAGKKMTEKCDFYLLKMSCLRKKDHMGKTHKAKPKLCDGERILKKTSVWESEPFTLLRDVFPGSLSPSPVYRCRDIGIYI